MFNESNLSAVDEGEGGGVMMIRPSNKYTNTVMGCYATWRSTSQLRYVKSEPLNCVKQFTHESIIKWMLRKWISGGWLRGMRTLFCEYFCVSIYQQLNDTVAKNYETIQNSIKCVIECWDNGIALLVHTQLYSVHFSTHLLWRQWAMLNGTVNRFRSSISKWFASFAFLKVSILLHLHISPLAVLFATLNTIHAIN